MRIARQPPQVLGKPLKVAVSKQVILDVGRVERRQALAARGHQGANGGDGVRAAQVADDGNDEVVRFERFHELEVVLRRKVVPLMAALICAEQQIAVRGIKVARRPSPCLELE